MVRSIAMLARGAVADRKGATALEYALIAGGLSVATLGGFRVFFNGINGFISNVTFS